MVYCGILYILPGVDLHQLLGLVGLLPSLGQKNLQPFNLAAQLAVLGSGLANLGNHRVIISFCQFPFPALLVSH